MPRAEREGTDAAPRVPLRVNGEERSVPLAPDRRLLAVLREDLGLTGAKPGCGEGECGACTVLLDGVAVRACVTPLAEALGHDLTTIEGLADGTTLHPVQRAFLEADAFQCGYCTPGMILAAAALLAHDPHPDDAAIVAAMNGNVCRCGDYPRILAAIRAAAGRPGEGRP